MPKTTRCGGILGFINKGGRKGEKAERRLNGYAVSGFNSVEGFAVLASPFLGLMVDAGSRVKDSTKS